MAGNSKSGIKPLDLTGKKFNYLRALERLGSRNGRSMWLCKCICGRRIAVELGALRVQKSCGCMRAKPKPKHGMYGTPTYRSWLSMKQRCLNPNVDSYRFYGGRGICIHEPWMKFENFLADMGLRPDGTSLDRIDCNKSYYPENCRWATSDVQAANKRSSTIRFKARPDLLKRGIYF